MISIIIAYNKNRGFLKEAIKSAENQDFNNYEIVVHQGNHNLSKNFNDAVRKAKGDYIKIFAEDDLLLPNCLADLYEGIKGYDFVNADALNFGSSPMWLGGEYQEVVHKGKLTNLPEMLFGNCLHGLTLMWRAELFFKVGGFDENLSTAEEYDFNLLLLSKGYKIGYVPKVVGHYRIHDTNKSINLDAADFHKRKADIKKLMQERYG